MQGYTGYITYKQCLVYLVKEKFLLQGYTTSMLLFDIILKHFTHYRWIKHLKNTILKNTSEQYYYKSFKTSFAIPQHEKYNA